jgi:hypothetical protein
MLIFEIFPGASTNNIMLVAGPNPKFVRVISAATVSPFLYTIISISRTGIFDTQAEREVTKIGVTAAVKPMIAIRIEV